MQKKKNIIKMNKISFVKEFIKIFVMDKKIITTLFISTFISGFIAHGVGLINKYCFHDDIMCINIHGSSFSSGRFTLAITDKLGKYFFGIPNFSLQLINGLFAFVFISFISILIVKILDIKNKFLMISIPCLLITSPSITSLLAYRYVSHIFLLSIFLGTLYIYILVNNKNKYIFLILSFLNAFNIGIYQGFISFYLSITCLYIIKESYEKKYDIKKTLLFSVRFIFYHLLSLVFYLILMKLSLYVVNTKLDTYSGINTLGVTSFSGYINRIIDTYKYYLVLPLRKSFNIFLLNTYIQYYIILIITIILIVKNKIYKKFSSGTIFAFIFLPICIHFNIVMGGNEYRLIQAFSVVFQYIFLLFIIDKIATKKDHRYIVSVIAMLVLIIYQYTYLSNLCYLKADFLQSKQKTYNEILITRIYSTPNYKINMPVCYINEFNKNTDDVFIKPEFNKCSIPPYNDNDLRNNFAWRQFMMNWNGFRPEVLPKTEFENSPIVKNMPCYPDDGSIKVINNVVVVKFSD